MKKLTCALLSATVLFGSALSVFPASADQPGPWHQDGGGPRGGHDGHHGGPGGYQGGQGGHHGGPDHFAGGPHHGGFDGPHGGPGGGPRWHEHRHGGDFAWRGHRFAPGRPMPPGFYGPHYRVDDWRGRGLPPPPPGNRWSYINGNYVLVAIATGVITSIILNQAFQ